MLRGVSRTAIALLIVFAIAVWAYQSWTTKREQRQQNTTARNAEHSQRFKDWAYVAKVKEIAPGETVKLVVIPSPYSDALDTKCLIYANMELKTNSMICPDASREFIAENEE